MHPGAAPSVALPLAASPAADLDPGTSLHWRGLAHDLRNQLTIVLGCCDLLPGAAADRTKLTRYSEHIRAAALSCADIAATMLRPPVRAAADLPTVELHGLLVEELSLLCGEYLRAGVTLSVERAAGNPLVRVDRVDFGRIVVNLVANARDALLADAVIACPRRPLIVVSTALAPAAGRVVVSVADNGPGIPTEYQASVWEEGFSTKRPAPGTRRGFGLAVVRAGVERVGGEVSLESELGQGTVFRVSLPLAS